MSEDQLGSDFACVEDVDENLTFISGRTALAQAVARRWLTTPGTLFYDLQYGGGLQAMLNSQASELSRRGYVLERQALLDERVESAEVSVTYIEATQQVTVQGRITDEDGPFDLTLSVDAYGALIGATGEYSVDANSVTAEGGLPPVQGASAFYDYFGSSLLFEFIATDAISDGSGRVSGWPVRSGSLSTSLSQPTAGLRPYLWLAGGPGGQPYVALQSAAESLVSSAGWGSSETSVLIVAVVRHRVGVLDAASTIFYGLHDPVFSDLLYAGSDAAVSTVRGYRTGGVTTSTEPRAVGQWAFSAIGLSADKLWFRHNGTEHEAAGTSLDLSTGDIVLRIGGQTGANSSQGDVAYLAAIEGVDELSDAALQLVAPWIKTNFAVKV